MVLTCCVKGCKSESYKGSNVSFHRFPKNEELRKKWVDIVPGNVTQYSAICGLHFKAEDFATHPIASRKMLKANATPSIFPKIIPENKKVHVHSSIIISQAFHGDPGTSSEPPSKKMKLEHGAAAVATQTTITASTPRKAKLRRQIKTLSQRLKRRNVKINNLKSLLNILKKKCDNYDEVENMVRLNFENIHEQFNKNMSHRGIRYNDEIKSFALSLYYYSSKAYKFLRNHISLPHPATLRRILSTHDCNVGFMTEVLNFLKIKISENPDFANVTLIFDSMHIKSQHAYDSAAGKFWGKIDYGGILPEDVEKIATEALVFQIVSLKDKLKCPIAYFFVDKISAFVQAKLVETAIRKLADIGIIVRSLTADGTAVNISTFEILGCSFGFPNMKTYFDHPSVSTKVHCILDPAHMIKLARNVFAETSMTSDNGVINFQFVKRLHELQEKEGLKLANKISKTHVNFFGKKMNVRLAVQVLSSSVANAIEFLRCSGHPDFIGSEATVEYLRVLDRIFDLFNSKNPFASGFKSPMRRENKEIWLNVLNETRNYLSRLKVNGENILSHRRKTPALGLIVDTFSFAGLADDLLERNAYFLTHKCSQDHLEMFFSCIRARGGSNDNPNALQFKYTMRKLLFRNSIKPSINANCTDTDYETSPILDFRSTKRDLQTLLPNTSQTSDGDEENYIEKLMKQADKSSVSDFKNNILYYISGYIVNKILDKITCQHCQAALLVKRHEDHSYIVDICKFSSFTAFVDKGGLKYASKFVFEVVRYAEILFNTASHKIWQEQFKNKLVLTAIHHFYPKLNNIFIPPHPVLSIRCENIHEIEVIKCIASKYFDLRLRAYGKSETLKLIGHKATMRQKLRKTILFSNV